MKPILVAACVAFAPTLPFAVRGGSTQGGAPSNSLARALAVFDASDVDHDGKISAAEARAIPVSPEEIVKADLDGDGFWSRDEFTLYYRARLVSGGQTVGQDLDAEVARIQALKRVRSVEEARKQGVETPGRRCTAEPACVRFEKALADLETSAAARKATSEDFRRLRNLVILSGRSVPDSKEVQLSSAASARMLQTLDRIEKRAAVGQYSSDDFDTLRTLAVTPAPAGAIGRGAPGDPSSRPGSTPVPSGTPSPSSNPGNAADRNGSIQGPADARRRASDPRLPTRPAPKTPPQPESVKPPTPNPTARPAPPPDPKKDSGPGSKS